MGFTAAHQRQVLQFTEHVSTLRRLKSPIKRGKRFLVAQVEKDYGLPDLSFALHLYLRGLPTVQSNFLPASLSPASVANMTVRLFTQLRVPVKDEHDLELIHIHTIRSVANWRRKGARRDFALFLKSGTAAYGSLQGHSVGQVELLFRIDLPFGMASHNLVFMTELQATSDGHVQRPYQLVRFNQPPAVDYNTAEVQSHRIVMNIKSIQGSAHMGPRGDGN